MVAGQRGVPDAAVRSGGDAIGAATERRRPDLDLPGGRVEAAVEAVLPGKPEAPLRIEHGGIQVGPGRAGRQGKDLDGEAAAIDPDDGVESAVGDPGRPLAIDDYPMRSRARAQRHLFGHPALRVEAAQCALALRGVPDPTIRGRGHVMRAGARRQRVVLHLRGLDRAGAGAEQQDQAEGDGTVHGRLPKQRCIALWTRKPGEGYRLLAQSRRQPPVSL